MTISSIWKHVSTFYAYAGALLVLDRGTRLALMTLYSKAILSDTRAWSCRRTER